jgi:hypothetical protein
MRGKVVVCIFRQLLTGVRAFTHSWKQVLYYFREKVASFLFKKEKVEGYPGQWGKSGFFQWWRRKPFGKSQGLLAFDPSPTRGEGKYKKAKLVGAAHPACSPSFLKRGKGKLV